MLTLPFAGRHHFTVVAPICTIFFVFIFVQQEQYVSASPMSIPTWIVQFVCNLSKAKSPNSEVSMTNPLFVKLSANSHLAEKEFKV
jgi:hypothetical protein